MRGYSETKVFSSYELSILKKAQALVEIVPAKFTASEIPESQRIVRCHELARAVGHILGLQVVDGVYGIIFHSWLDLGTKNHILDVYVPGALPAVQIIDLTPRYHPMRQVYEATRLRDDIRHSSIEELLRLMNKMPKD